MKKLTKYMTGILIGTFLLGTTAFAAEVTPVSGIGYTTADTEVKTEASETGVVFLTKEQCPDNIPLLITGITDNGYWEVDLGQENKFYIVGAGLVNINGNENVVQAETQKNVSVNDDVPIDTINAAYCQVYGGIRKVSDSGIPVLKKNYAIYMQAVNKLLNGTTNVTYYSDDVLENETEDVACALCAYFKLTYPNYTIANDWETGYAYARNSYVEPDSWINRLKIG